MLNFLCQSRVQFNVFTRDISQSKGAFGSGHVLAIRDLKETRDIRTREKYGREGIEASGD